jgi:hypothetical protein
MPKITVLNYPYGHDGMMTGVGSIDFISNTRNPYFIP